MRRRNEKVVVGFALVLLAVAAIIPVTAQARSTPTDDRQQSDYPAWAMQIETPYWFSKPASVIPDDRPFAKSTTAGNSDRSDYPAWAMQIETPYWFSKPAGVIPDDRSFARSMTVDSTPTAVVSDGGRSVDFNAYTVTGLLAVLLLAIGGGMAAGVMYSRRTKLSPA
ncbi:MAG: hypothetical protein ACRDNH_00545 [Gaiellaceae bacterium]